MVEALRLSSRWRCFAGWSLYAIALALAHNQLPLYHTNQNTKFIFGLKDAGYGLLQEDWFANTTDALPVFSFLVRVTYAHLHEACFYGYFAVLIGVYAYSITGIVRTVFPHLRSRSATVVFLAFFMLIHSIVLEKASTRMLGVNVRAMLGDGVAFQYVLGPVFQNCVFGVLLFLSLYWMLQRKYFPAVAAHCSAAIFHSVYMFPAMLLTIVCMVSVAWDSRKLIKPFALGLFALLLVLPIVVYSLVQFRPTSPELHAQAMDLAVYVRNPHHSLPGLWGVDVIIFKFCIVLPSLYLARKTRLFPAMCTLFAAGVALTLVSVSLGNERLAFLMPWRMSIVLVPLSSGLLLAWVVSGASRLLKTVRSPLLPFAVPCALGVIAILTVAGVMYQAEGAARVLSAAGQPVIQYVKEHRQAGEVYMIPPMNTDFERFRLDSGAPIIVNWKGFPQPKDTEMLEWKERMRVVYSIYYGEGDISPYLRHAANAYGVTHAIFPADHSALSRPFPAEPFRDNAFVLVTLEGLPGGRGSATVEKNGEESSNRVRGMKNL